MKKFFNKFVTLAFVCVAVATMAYAVQGTVKTNTYYTSASATTSTVARTAPVGNLVVTVQTTAVSGTPSITPTVQGVDGAGNVFDICAGAAITSTNSAVQSIMVGPSLTVSGVAGNTPRCSAVVPDLFQVKMVNASGVATQGASAVIYYSTSP